MAKKKQSSRLTRVFKLGFAYGILLLLVITVASGVVWFRALTQARAEMPGVEAELSNLHIPPSEILSANGEVLYEESDKFQEPVTLNQVPKVVQEAIISAEDRRFYQHSGVDIWALMRAVFVTAKNRRFSQGASTLAMQLAKRLTSKGQKTLSRKLNDMALAYEMENEWSKHHVLQLYLNEVYFGEGAYGIKAAAQTYFNKELDQLTLAEAAMLARCVRRPSDENPFVNLSKSIANRNVVLQIMKEDNLISESQYQKAVSAKVHLGKRHVIGSARILAAPYFVVQVLQNLKQNHPSIDLKDGGYQIYTTLNTKVQDATENAVLNVVQNYSDQGVNQGAFVLFNRQGGIIAEVGGTNYEKNQFNIVTMGSLQPGSSFKPIVYATAIANNILSADSYVSNDRFVYVDPKTHKVWSPRNDNGEYGGQVSVREAVADSINVPAVRTLTEVGIPKVIRYAHKIFGIKSHLPPFPTLALGACTVSPLEMGEAYSVFFLRGDRFKPYTIDHINDADGLVVYSHGSSISQNVLDSRVCDQMDSLLQGVVADGTGTYAQAVPHARGKTGTTNDNKDAWFCGYDRNFLGIGWTGNETYSKRFHRYIREPMSRSVFGGTVTIRIWVDSMLSAEKFITTTPPPPVSNPASDSQNTASTSGSGSNPSPDGTAQDLSQQPGNGLQNTSESGVKNGGPAGARSGTSSVPSPGPGSNGSSNNTQATSPSGSPPANSNPPADPNLEVGNTTALNEAPSNNIDSGLHSAHTKKVKYVWVWVCADSGDLATPYCPETVRRRFVKGTQPTKYCPLHHP